MAGNLPVPQGVEAKLVFTKLGVPFALNILHFEHAVGQLHSQARADQLDALVKTAFTASSLATMIHPNVALARVESRHMDSNSDPWYLGSGAAVAGTGTGEPLPPQISFAVPLKTGLRGRSYNGRVFLTGFTEASNDTNGQISAAGAGFCAAFLDQIRSNALTQLSFTMGVLTRWMTPPGSPPNTPPIERNPPDITPITSSTGADLRWDTQRRRAIPGI